MATFPISAAPLWGSYGHDNPKRATVRTQMEVGPPKVRRRTSMGATTFSAAYAVTTAILADFEAWFRNDAGMGAISFEWTDPRTEALRVVKFAEDAYEVASIAPGHWELRVKIEEWA